MTPEVLIEIAQNALYLAGLLCAPILSATLVVGVTISTLQAATQVNEMTLTFIPKLLAVGAVIYGTGAWMLEQWLGYVQELWSKIATMGMSL
jgi:flagellar biosynthetic protein FliQ